MTSNQFKKNDRVQPHPATDAWMSPTAPKAGKARETLGWCRHGHQKMRSNPTGQDWVLIWAGTIALLRAVGHVLEKEDATSDARLKKVQRSWWRDLNTTKPNPTIFWEFIDRDRNLLLKEAELTVGHSAEVFYGQHRPQTHARPQTHEQIVPEPLPYLIDHLEPPPRAIYTYQLNSGCFAGQDPRDLVRDAIEWWEKQLDDIEQKAAAPSP
jgi:hypothetical protein